MSICMCTCDWILCCCVLLDRFTLAITRAIINHKSVYAGADLQNLFKKFFTRSLPTGSMCSVLNRSNRRRGLIKHLRLSNMFKMLVGNELFTAHKTIIFVWWPFSFHFVHFLEIVISPGGHLNKNHSAQRDWGVLREY